PTAARMSSMTRPSSASLPSAGAFPARRATTSPATRRSRAWGRMSMGNSRAGDPRPEPAPAAPGEAFEPEASLGDPKVGDVPMTMPRPDESEAQAAERVARDAGQDAWGEP